MNQIDNQVIQMQLYDWFQDNARNLPWRINKDPYRVWVSEIMLQQTRVEAVIDYFNRFMERLPTVLDLANVDDEELYKLWQGLGYYTRAKNLKKAAGVIIEQYSGNIPNSYETLITLPGIGPYTAGAIASIAFNKLVPAIDGNVLRVISRIYGNKLDITTQEAKQEVTNIVKSLLPEENVGSFNQALMELGATICIPNGKPKCFLCPVNHTCYAYQTNEVEQIPVKSKKGQRLIQPMDVLIIKVKDGWIIHKREEKGLLANLWEFPNLNGNHTNEELMMYLKGLGIQVNNIAYVGKSTHIFTHKEWHMNTYLIEGLLIEDVPTRYVIATQNELKDLYSVPTAFSHCINIINQDI